jgi:hypothetical protein
MKDYHLDKLHPRHKLFTVTTVKNEPVFKRLKKKNKLNKRLNWTKSEQSIFIEMHRKFGNKWARLAKKLSGK